MRMRRCAASGETLPETALLRFVAGPDQTVLPDIALKLPGRGVWVEANRDTLETAIKRGAFARSLKQSAKPAPDLVELTERLLEERCLAQLGMAKKSGVLVTGFEKTRDAARTGRVSMVLEASDGAEDGRQKVLALLANSCPNAYIVGAFSKIQLGLALGLENVVHAALTGPGQAARLAREIGRLSGFRSVWPVQWTVPQALRAVSGVQTAEVGRPSDGG